MPHVTIAPIARGVGRQIRNDSRYFPYYTRPWITDAHFTTTDPHITGAQARAIDSAIDQYNDAIASIVKTARQSGKDWYVLDLAGLLDRLACRRYISNPAARPDWWTPYELPPALRALTPVPDSQFLTADEHGRKTGGLFSLDGIHPTTACYGILAQEVIRIMERAGVTFYYPNGTTPRRGPIAVDFARLIDEDTLTTPPTSITDDLQWLGWRHKRGLGRPRKYKRP